MLNFILLSFLVPAQGVESASTADAIANELYELTYAAWTDNENWTQLIEAPGELASLTNEEAFENFLNQSVLVMQEAVDPIDNWENLTAAERAAYLTDVGFFFVGSIIVLKLAVTRARSFRHEAGFRIYQAFGYRTGKLEPENLPGFLYSSEFHSLVESAQKDSSLSRRQKRKIAAQIRAYAIFRSTGDNSYRPRAQEDFAEWKNKLEAAYQSYRQRRVDRRWDQMPRRHRRFFGHPTPHIDEVLRAVVDFSMEKLSQREQRKLILFLEKLAKDFTKTGRPQARYPRLSFRTRSFIRENRDVFRFWRSELQGAVRSDEWHPMSYLIGIERREVAPDGYREELRERFRRYLCGRKFFWLGLID